MKFLKLRIHNIASIEDARIDFDSKPLSETSIFLICGETGAGKSTILDSICLALYSTTPRMLMANNEKIFNDLDGDLQFKDPRQLLRQGTGEGYTELHFIGTDDVPYVARWSVHRAKNSAKGVFQPREWTLQNLKTGETLKKVNEIEPVIFEKAVGLSFEQFCRTSMLAQGEFTLFLSSKEEEKAEILEKLTGTEIYSEIGRKIFEKARFQKEMIRSEEARINMLSLLSEEEVRDKSNIINKLEEENSYLSKQSELLKTGISLLSEIEGNLAEQQKILQEKTGLESSFKDCLAGINHLHHEKSALERKKIELHNHIQSFSNVRLTLDNSQRVCTSLRNVISDKKEIERQQEALSALNGENDKFIARLNEAKRLTELAKEDIEKSRKSVSDTSDEIQVYEKEKLSQEKDSLKTHNELINNTLWKIKNYFSDIEEKKKNEERIKEAKKTFDKEADTQKQIEEKFRESDTALQHIQRYYEIKKSSMDEWPNYYREKLQPGDVCPLCGHTIENKLHNSDFHSELSPLEKEVLEAKVYRDNLLGELNSSRTLISGILKNIQEIEAYVKDKEVSIKSKLSDLNNDFKKIGMDVPTGFDTGISERLLLIKSGNDSRIAEIDGLLNVVANLEKTLAGQRQKLDAANKILIERSEAERLCEDAYGKHRNDIKICQNNIDNANSRIAAVRKEIAPLILYPDWAQEWRKDAEFFISRIETDARTLTEKTNEANMTDRQFQEVDNKIMNSEVIIKDILSEYPDFEVLRNESSIEDKNLNLNLNRVGNLANTLKHREKDNERKYKELQIQKEKFFTDNPDISIDDKTEESISACIENLRNNQIQIGRLRQELESDEKAKKQFSEISLKINKMKKESENMDRLARILGDSNGKTFKKIAQSYILRQLLVNANHYLSKLSPRYELDAQAGSLIVVVRDKFAGGAQRVGHTLSGGESFIASLALALGLSSIGGKGLSVDTLFIDEGFGTLSEDYLSVVMEMLEKLHNIGGKKVGIISHVKTLSENVRVQIHVNRIDNTRSKVEIKEI